MPKFKTSYDTTVGSMVVTKPIEHAIKVAIVSAGIDCNCLNVSETDHIKPIFVTGVWESEREIPLFTHPIMVKNFQGREGKDYLCSDIRFFIRKDADPLNIESGIKNLTEFNYSKSRAILNLLWLENGENRIRNSLPFGGTVFAAWLSEVISKTYALDFKDQTTLAIISHFYYQSLFSEETVFNEDDKQRMAVHTIKATKAPAAFVFEIFDKIGKIEGIDDYCKNVVSILENVRLRDFNLPMLLTIIRNSWYGLNAKEHIQVSIEHPPTWLAILFTALNERTYKNSMIYRIAERFGKKGAADEFNKTYLEIMQSSTFVRRAVEEFYVPAFEDIPAETFSLKVSTEDSVEPIGISSKE